MKFLWPELLWLFLGVPALIGLYFALLRRPAKRAVAYPAIGLFGAKADAMYRWRTHIPALLLLTSICALLAAAARPVIGDARHLEPRTLIVMIDVSYSMGAADVAPTRLQVAKEAAAAVVEWQPQDVLIGVVAFSGNAQLVQAPTGSRTAVLEALNKLELQSGSALGTGLLGSLMTLFPEHDLAGGYDVFGHYVPRFAYPPVHRSRDETTQPADRKRVRPGSNALARIVVLSDGQSTHGVPIEVAQAIAGDYGVRVFTVGIGTAGGGTVEVSGQLFQVGFDEKNLVDIAGRTQGVHWRLNDVTDVARVFESMRAAAAYEPRLEEMSVYLSALGLCLLLAAAIVSSRPYPVLGGKRIVDR